MDITPEMVKELRERTGAGIMECKRALQKAQGDPEAAARLLREEGVAKADTKVGRAAGEGVVAAFVAGPRNAGALVEVNCETDFVARTEPFGRLAAELAEQVCAQGAPPDLAALLDRPALRGSGGQTVGQVVKEAIATLGENIVLRRAERLALAEGANGLVTAYLHPGGKVGVLVAATAGTPTASAGPELARLARDVAMQVAAMAPRWLRREDVPADVLDRERAILRAQPDMQGKPPAVQAKIVEGRLGKFYAEACLLEQPFIRDEEHKATVKDLIRGVAKALATTVEVRQFSRFKVGEAS